MTRQQFALTGEAVAYVICKALTAKGYEGFRAEEHDRLLHSLFPLSPMCSDTVAFRTVYYHDVVTRLGLALEDLSDDEFIQAWDPESPGWPVVLGGMVCNRERFGDDCDYLLAHYRSFRGLIIQSMHHGCRLLIHQW